MAQPINKRLVAVIIGLNSLLVPTAITIVVPSLRSLSLELDCDASSAAMIISVCARPQQRPAGDPDRHLTVESPVAAQLPLPPLLGCPGTRSVLPSTP